MTEQEFESLKRKSKDLGVTKSSLILDTINGISVENYKIKRERLIGLIKISSEVKKIGININQVTMKLNNLSNEKKLGFDQIITGLQNEINLANKMMNQVLNTINEIR